LNAHKKEIINSIKNGMLSFIIPVFFSIKKKKKFADDDPSDALAGLTAVMENFADHDDITKEFFVQDLGPAAVAALLARGEEFQAEDFETYNAFLEGYLKFVKEEAIDFDLVGTYESLAAIFDPSLDFYQYGGQIELDDEGADGQFITQTCAPQECVLFLINFNYFGRIGGFDSMFRRLEDHGVSRPNLEVVHWMTHVLQKNINIMHPPTKKFFGLQMRRIVPAFLESCTAEKLQHEDNKNISGTLSQLEHALRASIGPTYRQDYEISKINLGNRLLRLGLLNKRLLGLQLICEVAEGARAALRRDIPPDKMGDQWMTPAYLANWMVQNGLLEYLYGDGAHAELLARCASCVPGLLAEVNLLREEQIDLIWNAAVGQHESIVTEVYKALPIIAGFVCNANLFAHMYKKLEAVPCGAYDVHMINLIRDFTVQAVARMEMLKNPKVDRTWFGLELLWNYTQDGSGAANAELEQLACSTLAQLFGLVVFQSQRPVLMERCVKQIEAGHSVPQAQALLVSIIMSYPPGVEENQVSSVILWLQKRYDLIDLVMRDIVRYQKIALAQAASVPPGQDVNMCVFRGSRPHHVNVMQRKNLLGYLLVRASLELTSAHLEQWWQAMVVDAVSDWERSLTFCWWQLSLSPISTADEVAGVTTLLFSDSSVQFMFEKFQTLSPEVFNDEAFKCFRAFFNRVNSSAHLLQVVGDNRYIVSSSNLFGVDTLWRLAISAPIASVSNDATTLLVLLQKNVSDSIAKGHLGEFRHLFVRQCMTQLQEAVAAGDTVKFCTKKKLFVF
jgi:hypothetical protein